MRLALAALLAVPGALQAAPPVSGFSYLSDDLKRLQRDAFANPGLFWIERGARLWSQPTKSCAGCHGDAARSMRGVATRYPAYDPRLKRVINLEQRINACRKRSGAASLPYESQDLLALTAYVTNQSRGLPLAVRTDGPAGISFDRGKRIYERRIGQLNLSCRNCHEQNVGRRLRGDVISQGQINGFPIYRQIWQTAGSTHRMFTWCNQAVRAEPLSPGAQSYVDLELYVKWRGRGLPIESPAMRK